MTGTDKKIEIRCSDPNIKTKFKRVAADFDSYEHLIAWLVEGYEEFKKIRPPSSVASKKMRLKHGVY